ncbi:hypothetical protein GGR57DRAFT_514220 [Xylariaceae sp. FL1272]|nr:hypothetical protein GGR57DRAFT_514220 [Xylariaceae sp. FL1272]
MPKAQHDCPLRQDDCTRRPKASPLLKRRSTQVQSGSSGSFTSMSKDLGILAWRAVCGPGGVNKAARPLSSLKKQQKQRSAPTDANPPGISRPTRESSPGRMGLNAPSTASHFRSSSWRQFVTTWTSLNSPEHTTCLDKGSIASTVKDLQKTQPSSLPPQTPVHLASSWPTWESSRKAPRQNHSL